MPTRQDGLVDDSLKPALRNINLRADTRARIYQALKASGHWYIVSVWNWEHHLNRVDNCLAIMFDGSIQCKFEIKRNGRLKLEEVRSKSFLDLEKGGLFLGKEVSVTELIAAIHRVPHESLLRYRFSLPDLKQSIKENDKKD